MHYNLNKISRDGLEIVTVTFGNAAKRANVNCKLFILSGSLIGIWINVQCTLTAVILLFSLKIKASGYFKCQKTFVGIRNNVIYKFIQM